MFIVCEGKVAEHPYVMPYTGRKVYSLEELSVRKYLQHQPGVFPGVTG